MTTKTPAIQKYYTLCTLQDGKYYRQFGSFIKMEVQEEQKNVYAGYKSRIITTGCTQDEIDKGVADLNAKLAKPSLALFKYADIANTILLNAGYQHVQLFANKQDAVMHISNFTAWQSHNKCAGTFTTNLSYTVINEQLFHITVFSKKEVLA